MSPPKKISDADRELFREAVVGVKPLPQKVEPVVVRVKNSGRKVTVVDRSIRTHSLEIDDVAAMGCEDVLAFARNGIASRTMLQLRRGRLVPSATLDLHGMRANAAQIALDEFLRHCVSHDARCVRVVHGKGGRERNTASVLKSIVNHWLREQESVLAFCSAPQHDGGAGAVYVLLKRAPNE